MSNLVEQIIEAAELEVKKETAYSELKYVYDLEKNDDLKNSSRFGVRPLEAPQVAGLNKVYTVDQVFNVVLVTAYKNKPQDDIDLRQSIKELYNKMDEVIKAFHLNKLGLNSIVLSINLSSINEPEIFEENKIVALSADFIIKYRNTVD